MADRDEERKRPAPSFSETGQATKVGSVGVIPVREDRYGPGVVVEQKYELVRLLGEGGMGSVWVAKNLTLDVHVALKLMHSTLLQRVPGAAERMLQEARAAACITHPAIVQVFDFGKTRDGEPYISMELLHGESLAAALGRRGRLPAVRAIQVLLPIADALSVAHQRGIVHRDLKPDNVHLAQLADGRTQPKILDFGIAKHATDAKAMKLTLDGTVMGSPSYMSPEQARGESDIDQRADVWAFSVMLYELVTGQTPFQGQGYNALLWSILGAHPKPIAEHGIEEPELWNILERGLTKDRDFRFGDMRELGRALAGWLLARGVKVDITKAPLRAWLESADRTPERRSIFASMSPSGSSDAPHSIDIPSLPDLPVVIPRMLAEPPPPLEPARPVPVAIARPAASPDAFSKRTRTGDAQAEARTNQPPTRSDDARAPGKARSAGTPRNSVRTRQKRRAEARAVLEAALLFQAAPRASGKELSDSSPTAARTRNEPVHWAWFVVPAIVALSFFVAALVQEPAPVEPVVTPVPAYTSDSAPSESVAAPAIQVEPVRPKAEASDVDPDDARRATKATRARPKVAKRPPSSADLKNPFD